MSDAAPAEGRPPESRPPLPPFNEETAKKKIQAAEDAWNSRDPARVALAYTPDTEWRNRNEFLNGRDAVREFLSRKWQHELDYRLKKELWCFADNRIAVRFEYEWHDDSGQWYRSYGNENWEFAPNGLMAKRYASINDMRIMESERKQRWERKA
jgi:nuclear transport factor 2 (NTF2) superfamily protein